MAGTVNLKFEVEGASLVDLRNQLKDVRAAMAEATDPAYMSQLAAAAGEVKDKIGDVNESIKEMSAGSDLEKMSNSFSGMKEGLMSMDFGKVSESASNLAANVSKISFKSALSGVKDMGKAFLSLGKALLTNPYFLLAAITIAIGAAVMALLNKFGLLKPILDTIKAAVGFITDAFSALTDMIGLTDNAGKEQAENEKKAVDAAVVNAERKATYLRKNYEMTKEFTDEEKMMLEDATGAELVSLQEVEAAELDLLATKQEAAQLALNQAEDDAENKQELIDASIAADNAYTDGVIANATRRMQVSKDIQKTLDKLTAGAIATESGRAKAFLDIQEQETLAKLNTQLEDAKRRKYYGATPEEMEQGLKDTENLEKIIALTKADYAKQRVAIDKKASDGAAAVAKTASDKAKSDLEKRIKEELEALKKKNQLKLNDLTEGTQEYLTELQAGLDRELAFVKSKSKGLKQDKLDVQLFEDNINKQKATAQKVFDDKELVATNKLAIDKAEIAVREAKTFQEQKAAEIELIKANLAISLQAVEAGSDAEKILVADALTATSAIRAEVLADAVSTVNARVAIEQTARETERSAAEFDLAQFKGTQEAKIAALNEYNTLLLAGLAKTRSEQVAALDAELAAIEAKKLASGTGGAPLTDAEVTRTAEIEAQKAAIEEAYRQAKISATVTTEDAIATIKKEKFDSVMSDINGLAAGAAEAIQMISDIGTASLEIQANNMAARHAAETKGMDQESQAFKSLKKTQAAEELALAKKTFEINKKQQIAAAIMQGTQAVLAAFSSGSAIPVVGAVAGPAFAALAAIAATKNINKIKSSTFGGGTPPASDDTGGGSVPDMGGNGAGGDSATPAINLFGQGNNSNTETFGGGASGQTINVVATVSESDITSTQNRIAKMQNSSEL